MKKILLLQFVITLCVFASGQNSLFDAVKCSDFKQVEVLLKDSAHLAYEKDSQDINCFYYLFQDTESEIDNDYHSFMDWLEKYIAQSNDCKLRQEFYYEYFFYNIYNNQSYDEILSVFNSAINSTIKCGDSITISELNYEYGNYLILLEYDRLDMNWYYNIIEIFQNSINHLPPYSTKVDLQYLQYLNYLNMAGFSYNFNMFEYSQAYLDTCKLFFEDYLIETNNTFQECLNQEQEIYYLEKMLTEKQGNIIGLKQSIKKLISLKNELVKNEAELNFKNMAYFEIANLYDELIQLEFQPSLEVVNLKLAYDGIVESKVLYLNEKFWATTLAFMGKLNLFFSKETLDIVKEYADNALKANSKIKPISNHESIICSYQKSRLLTVLGRYNSVNFRDPDAAISSYSQAKDILSELLLQDQLLGLEQTFNITDTINDNQTIDRRINLINTEVESLKLCLEITYFLKASSFVNEDIDSSNYYFKLAAKYAKGERLSHSDFISNYSICTNFISENNYEEAYMHLLFLEDHYSTIYTEPSMIALAHERLSLVYGMFTTHLCEEGLYDSALTMITKSQYHLLGEKKYYDAINDLSKSLEAESELIMIEQDILEIRPTLSQEKFKEAYKDIIDNPERATEMSKKELKKMYQSFQVIDDSFRIIAQYEGQLQKLIDLKDKNYIRFVNLQNPFTSISMLNTRISQYCAGCIEYYTGQVVGKDTLPYYKNCSLLYQAILSDKNTAANSAYKLKNLIDNSEDLELINLFEKQLVLQKKYYDSIGISNDKTIYENYYLYQITKSEFIDTDYKNDLYFELKNNEIEIVKRLRETGKEMELLIPQTRTISQLLDENEVIIEFYRSDLDYQEQKQASINELGNRNTSINRTTRMPNDNYYAIILKRNWNVPKVVKLGNQKDLEVFDKEIFKTIYSIPDSLRRLITGSKEKNIDGLIDDFYKKSIKNDLSLYTLFWEPIKEFLSADDTVIYYSPSGDLNGISLYAIWDQEEEKFLIDDYTFKKMTSTAELIDYKDDFEKSEKISNLLAFTDVKYDDDKGGLLYDDNAKKYSAGLESKCGFNPNAIHDWPPYSTDSLISSIDFNAELIVSEISDTKATKANFINMLDSLKETEQNKYLLMIATHGYFYPCNFTDSINSMANNLEYVVNWMDPFNKIGLIFAGANKYNDDEFYKYIVTGTDISNLNLTGVELAILAACESGLGDLMGSEGVFGFQRAFKNAGVKYVLNSFWKVSIDESNIFIKYFLKNYINNEQDIYEAHRKAMLKIKKDVNNKPFYWAAYDLIR